MAFTLAFACCESALHAWYIGEVQLVLPPFPSDVFCVGLTSCGYGPPRQRRRYNIGKGELPSVLSSPNQPSRTISSIPSMCCHCDSRTHRSRVKIPIRSMHPMCPPENSKCNVTWPSNVINAAPHLPTTKNVKMKIHAPKTKHSRDSGDTCDSSASKKAQVYGPTLLSQAGATSTDVTWRKTCSQGA